MLVRHQVSWSNRYAGLPWGRPEVIDTAPAREQDDDEELLAVPGSAGHRTGSREAGHQRDQRPQVLHHPAPWGSQWQTTRSLVAGGFVLVNESFAR